MEHFYKTAHVGPLIVMGQIHIHAYCGYSMLKFVFPVKNRYGVLKILYTDLVDGYVAMIELILNIFHFNKYSVLTLLIALKIFPLTFLLLL